VLLTPVPYCRQPSTEPFGNRLHVHCELALSAAGAYVYKSQEVERRGFLTPLLRVLGGILPELNQPNCVQLRLTFFSVLGNAVSNPRIRTSGLMTLRHIVQVGAD